MRLFLLILLALPIPAATNRTVTVKTSGGDYTTLAAAIAGEKGDMVSLDRQLTIECYAMSDTTQASVVDADWTTDATRYVLITTPSSERHDGKWNTSKYRLEVANATAMVIREAFFRVDGLQITSTGNYEPFVITITGVATDIRLTNSIVKSTAAMATKGAIKITNAGSASEVTRFWNNLIYGATNGFGLYTDTTAGTHYFYNNTFAGCSLGVNRSAGTVILVNNLFTGNAATGSGAMGAGTDYNRTSNSTLGYTVTGSGNAHDAVSQAFTFVNAGAYDWHLVEADAGATDLGVSDPGSGLFSTDVDGETRSGSWDVGFDEYPSGAPTRRRNAVVAWRRQ